MRGSARSVQRPAGYCAGWRVRSDRRSAALKRLHHGANERRLLSLPALAEIDMDHDTGRGAERFCMKRLLGQSDLARLPVICAANREGELARQLVGAWGGTMKRL